MLFKRRTALSLRRQLRNLLWPKMGFRRTAQYYKHRTIRIPASDHSLGSGLAFGCAISFTLPITHLAQTVVFCWATRANFFAALIGTAFGNPWTLPAILFIDYHIGKALFISTGYGHMLQSVSGHTFGGFLKSLLKSDLNFQMLAENFNQFVLPTAVGGYFMALATYPLFYYPFFYMIKAARAARRAGLERKIHKEVAEITGQQD